MGVPARYVSSPCTLVSPTTVVALISVALMFSYFFLVITVFWILKPIKKGLFVGYYKSAGGLDLIGWHLDAAQAELIAKVLVHLDQIDFRLDDTEADVLGDAYEYLIGQFASGAGKKAGEFYTPQEVSTILAKIVTTGKTRLKNVYDPTCGSGSLLLRVAK